MSEPKLIRQTDAAKVKKVSKTAIAKALKSGTLTEYIVGGLKFVVDDELYQDYKPMPGKKRTPSKR